MKGRTHSSRLANNARQAELWNEELSPSPAHVWRELADVGIDRYRDDYSDHFPVTMCLDVRIDHDLPPTAKARLMRNSILECS